MEKGGVENREPTSLSLSAKQNRTGFLDADRNITTTTKARDM